jgi:thiamine pyrophosphate-dependent acetolactate synthase large subunit-like protein
MRAYDGKPPAHAWELMNFTNVNLAKVSEALGCFAVRVEKPSELRLALEAALAAGRPAVVDAVSDAKALPPPVRVK